MGSFCHIINPVKVNQSVDLFIAQPITFASLIRAADFSKKTIQPELLALCYNQDKDIVPGRFNIMDLSDRSIRTILNNPQKKNLPLLSDILNTAYKATQAEYIIYTNSDIAVQPHFYQFIAEKIHEGLDGFIINRRRIPFGNYTPEDLDFLYTQKGKSHPGFDCFIFKRELIPQMELGTVCVGIPFMEATLAYNLFALSRNFKLFDKEFLTFHLGMEIFKKRDKELYWHNRHQFFRHIKPRLWHRLDVRNIPYYDSGFPVRYIKWGLNPALFTLMNLKLDIRRIRAKSGQHTR
ncbi:MAG: hypothetical protein MH137_04935 [Flavobacteriales bacterium]|nr:hypothetical protein [Flavobacteriales bacterium]